MSAPSSKTKPHDAGIYPPGLRPDYKTYRSPYGPQYKVEPNFHGINRTSLIRGGITSALFGGALGLGLLYFASGVPRVRIDILQNVPIVGPYFIRETPPEDDPF